MTIWIIGATGGIGRRLTERLAETGHDLVISARSQEDLDSLAERVDSVVGVKSLDASDFDAVMSAAKSIAEEHGSLDGVVNLAGSMLLRPEHLTSYDDYRSTMRQNLDTAFAVVRAACKVMYSTGGSIVLISSAAASRGLKNHGAIAAAKAGIEGLVRSTAAGYSARGIRVNAVSPGMVQTPLSKDVWSNERSREYSENLHPLGRIGQPADVVPAIEMLLDPDVAGWTTGSVVSVDGGLAGALSR
ncbi:MAG: SDR family oxidoreductase [Rhodothermales bacterium]|nr:SDR family oxidoreductase [Rhodothermales bacterium]